MYIIRGKDYYDSCITTVDKSVQFVRDCRLFEKKDHPFSTNGEGKWTELKRRRVINPHSDNRVNCTLFSIVVCDTIYPVIVAGYEKFYFSAEEFSNDFEKRKQFFWDGSSPEKYLEEGPKKMSKPQLDWMIENQITLGSTYCSVPTRYINNSEWVASYRQHPFDANSKGTFLANHYYLQTMDFQRIVNPYEMMMKISNWVSGVLPVSKETVKLTDLELVDKHGFDRKISFRRRKQEI